jgi:hypothetical protein
MGASKKPFRLQIMKTKSMIIPDPSMAALFIIPSAI